MRTSGSEQIANPAQQKVIYTEIVDWIPCCKLHKKRRGKPCGILEVTLHMLLMCPLNSSNVPSSVRKSLIH